MCVLRDQTMLAIGMTDGNILILDCTTDVTVFMEGRFREIGGIWCIATCNEGQDLALGTIGGLYFVQIMERQLLRTDECYLEDKNVWNVYEYDKNKLVCTTWVTPHAYLIDRNDPQSLRKPKMIGEQKSKNNHCTDLIPLPTYNFGKCPYFLKRSAKAVNLIDVRNCQQY
jgi:hypothetical protein